MLGMDRRRARTPRRRRTTLTVEARHRRRSHAPTRALTRRRVGGKLPEKRRACDAGFRRGGHRRVDRPSALRNLWFSAEEELPEKSPAAVTAAAGGGGGGCGGEKEIRRRRRRSE